MSFTKGPWNFYVGSENYQVFSFGESKFHKDVCTVEKLANAHLIAAAPELYEAARVALTTYQGLQKAMLRTGIDVSPVIEILKETMAKARGES